MIWLFGRGVVGERAVWCNNGLVVLVVCWGVLGWSMRERGVCVRGGAVRPTSIQQTHTHIKTITQHVHARAVWIIGGEAHDSRVRWNRRALTGVATVSIICFLWGVCGVFGPCMCVRAYKSTDRSANGH